MNLNSLLKTDFIFAAFLILLLISFITFNFILLFNKLKELSEYKYNDIIISSFSSIDFIEAESYPVYNDSNPNLGLTGRLILDCYIGTCQKKDYYYDIDDDLTFDYVDYIDYSCSEQCSYNGKDECDCDDPFEEKGTCSRRYDDIYDAEKYCYADNVIYFWKGKKYTILKKDVYSYYKNAKFCDFYLRKNYKK